MTDTLQGKIAVITGGTAGLGLATAQRFIAEGAFVYITGRRQEELEAALGMLGPRAAGMQGDSSSLADLDRLYAAVAANHSRIDILFANAGGGGMAPIGDITEDMVDRIFAVNVKGVLFTVQKALPLLVDGASVILMGSAVASQGIHGFSIYGAAKAAIRAFARTWILDLKPRGIRINVISPGPIRTPGLVDLVPTEDQGRFLDQLAQTVPLGRVGEADEIATVAVFLASSASSFVTGIELFVDGGSAQI